MVSANEVVFKVVGQNKLSDEELSTLNSLDEYISSEIRRQYACDSVVNIPMENINYRIAHWSAYSGADILNELFTRIRNAGWRIKPGDETLSIVVS